MSQQNQAVTVVVPASSEYLQLIRLNVAGTLANAEFTIDEIEDVKIGVEELSAVLLSRGTGDRVELSILVDGEGATVVGERTAKPTESTELEDFVSTILEAVVDSFDLESTLDGLRFTIRKRLRVR